VRWSISIVPVICRVQTSAPRELKFARYLYAEEENALVLLRHLLLRVSESYSPALIRVGYKSTRQIGRNSTYEQLLVKWDVESPCWGWASQWIRNNYYVLLRIPDANNGV